MENQHRHITGYRELNSDEIDLMNWAKNMAHLTGEMISEMEENPSLDKRSLAIAKTHLQTGFMWAVRSVAQPESF